MLRGIKFVAAVAVVAFGVGASTAFADTPTPVAGSPGCGGQVVATTNHASGFEGASGSSQASAGPGYFLKSGTPDAIAGVREAFCS